MRISRLSLAGWLGLAIGCAATALANPATLEKAGVTKVIVTIPVQGVPSSLEGITTIPQLLSHVSGLSASEAKQILDAVHSGFVTAVRVESNSDGQSSWLEIPAAGSTISRGDSTFKIQPPTLKVIAFPRKPNPESSVSAKPDTGLLLNKPASKDMPR